MDFGSAISCIISWAVDVIQVEKERSFVVSFRRRPSERHFPFISRARLTAWTFLLTTTTEVRYASVPRGACVEEIIRLFEGC